MSSHAVNAKNDLVDFLKNLNAKLLAKEGPTFGLPDENDWKQFRGLVHKVLRLRRLSVKSRRLISWKELARLEKAYRPDLDFPTLLEPFLTAVEDDAEPYAKLQAFHWKAVIENRTLHWDKRDERARVLAWLIYEVRFSRNLFDEEMFPDYERFKTRHAVDGVSGTDLWWKIAGQLILEYRKGELVAPSREVLTATPQEAHHGFGVFLEFQKTFLRWRIQYDIWWEAYYHTERNLRYFENKRFEERLVKMRIISWGEKGSYRDIMVEGNSRQIDCGHIPTVRGLIAARRREADTSRKRTDRGAMMREMEPPPIRPEFISAREWDQGLRLWSKHRGPVAVVPTPILSSEDVLESEEKHKNRDLT